MPNRIRPRQGKSAVGAGWSTIGPTQSAQRPTADGPIVNLDRAAR